MIHITVIGNEDAIEYREGAGVRAPVPRHFHDHYQFCLVTAGNGFVRHRGTTYQTPAGTLFALAPGEVHENACTCDEGCSFLTLNVPARRLSPILSSGMADFTVTRDAAIVQSFRSVARGLKSEGEHQAALCEALSSFDRAPGPKAAAGSIDRVEEVRRMLRARCEQEVSLDELARHVGVTKHHLIRLFTARFGLPPHLFQIQCRISRARRLLLDGHEPGAVAQIVGFADQSHLTRHFKRLTAVTPGIYRRAERSTTF